MNKTLSHGSQDFDCSAYLSHGLQWPAKEVRKGFGWTRPSTGIPIIRECNTQYAQHQTESVKVRDWGVLLQEEMSAVSHQGKGKLFQRDISPYGKEKIVEKNPEKQYYETEYTTLVKFMDEEEITVPPPSMFADKREEIQRISLVVDEALGCQSYNSNWYYNRHAHGHMAEDRQAQGYMAEDRPAHGYMGDDRQAHGYMVYDLENEVDLKALETPRTGGGELLNPNTPSYDYLEPKATCQYFAKDVAIKAIETPRATEGVMSPRGFQNFVKEQLVGFGDIQEKKDGELKKRRLCRHFVKGFCLRGEACEFLHDASIFCTDDQKVFLGGLPLDMTPEILKDKLEKLGLTVLNRPKMMRGFTPQVCLGSVEQALSLIEERFIYIDEHRVDVRPYQDREQLRQGLPNIVKRSVFLGGLPENTTGEMIVDDLQRLDVKVVNFPVVKNGYAPRVVLESLEDAKMLVLLKRVMVNDTAVDVRPYVNFRKRY